MANVPKPLLGVLLAAVAFFAVWTVALKGNSSAGGASPNPVAPFQSAIAKAHQASTTSDAVNRALGATVTTTPAASSSHLAAAAQNTLAAATAHSASTRPTRTAAASGKASAASAEKQVSEVESALSAHKVVALLFYNPAAADDQAVKQELAAAAAPAGKVVKVAVPVSELSRFAVVSNQIPVTTAPTLLIIDRAGQATSLTGFTDRFEITQRIRDALQQQ